VPTASPAGAGGSSTAASPSPTGAAKDLAFTGSNDLLPLTGIGLLAIGGGALALRVRARRKGAHRA
jgi:hypothetical protein